MDRYASVVIVRVGTHVGSGVLLGPDLVLSDDIGMRNTGISPIGAGNAHPADSSGASGAHRLGDRDRGSSPERRARGWSVSKAPPNHLQIVTLRAVAGAY